MRLRLGKFVRSGATRVPRGVTWAATAPELADRGGLYLEDCGIAEVSEEGPGGVNPWALDPEAARRLFEVSEKMLGERFA